MTKKLILLTMSITLAAALTGCGDKSSGTKYVPKPPKEPAKFALAAGQEKTIFPMVVGNQWVYEVQLTTQDARGQQGNGATELTFTVTEVKEVNGGTEGTLEVTQVDASTKKVQVVDSQIWRVDSTGLYQVKIGIDDAAKKTKVRAFSPPQTVIAFPIAEDKSFEWKGSAPIGDKVGPASMAGMIKGTLNVDTGIGDLNALKVEQIQNWSINGEDAKMTTTSYWAAGVGLVRMFQQVESSSGAAGMTRLNLKSKALKAE
jgi:hypothetical protein